MWRNWTRLLSSCPGGVDCRTFDGSGLQSRSQLSIAASPNEGVDVGVALLHVMLQGEAFLQEPACHQVDLFARNVAASGGVHVKPFGPDPIECRRRDHLVW